MHHQPSDQLIRVLVIEDNRADAKLCEHSLCTPGQPYEVAWAETIQAARQLASERSFDIILSDLGLPGSEGMETIELCRALWPEIPIVVLSGLANESLAREAVRAGAQDYLVKDEINPRALRKALRYAFERHRNAEERRRLMGSLEESRKLEALGRLAAGVAHEINTPTQYVSSNLEFLEEALGELMGCAQRLANVRDRGASLTADELNRMLEDLDVDYLASELPRSIRDSMNGLGTISRIVRAMRESSHPGDAERITANLNDTVESALTVATSEWRAVAELERDFEAELPPLTCMPGELHQVFLNLIINAAHAIEDARVDDSKGLITVRTRSLPGAVEVVIEDTGGGIPDENVARIFEPFFTTKAVGRGTGQGLAIAHNVVVNNHGGSITWSPGAGGRGSRFEVRLPLDPPAELQSAA